MSDSSHGVLEDISEGSGFRKPVVVHSRQRAKVRVARSSDSNNSPVKSTESNKQAFSGDSSEVGSGERSEHRPESGTTVRKLRIKAHSRHHHSSPLSGGSHGSKGSKSSKGSRGSKGSRSSRTSNPKATPTPPKTKNLKTRWFRNHLKVQSLVKKVIRRLSSAEQSEDEGCSRTKVEEKKHAHTQESFRQSHPIRAHGQDQAHHKAGKRRFEVKFLEIPKAPPSSTLSSPISQTPIQSVTHSRRSSFNSEWSDIEELTLEQKFSVNTLQAAARKATASSENLLRVAVTQAALSVEVSPVGSPQKTPRGSPPTTPTTPLPSDLGSVGTNTINYERIEEENNMSKEIIDSLKKEIEQWYKVKHCESMTYGEFTDILSSWLLDAYDGRDDQGQALYEKLTQGLESFAVIDWNDIHRVLMSGDDELIRHQKEQQERQEAQRRSSTFSDSDDIEGETSSYRTPVRAIKRATLERNMEEDPGRGSPGQLEKRDSLSNVLPVPSEYLSPGRVKSSTNFAETTPDFANRGGKRLPSILSSRVSDETLQHQVEEKARQASALPPHMSMRTLRRTASLDVVTANTVSDPDQEEAIRSVALAILQRIDAEGLEEFGLRPEMHHRLKADPEGIYRFISNIFVKGELRTECLISCLVYIDRLCVTPEDGKGRYVQLDTRNWKALVTAALVIASKVWDDESLINEDFSILTQFSLEQINTWEQEILYFIKFDVQLSSSLYAAYYFNMRTLYKKYSGLFGRGSRADNSSGASVFKKLNGHHRRYSTML